jgi:hypothetical protein
MSKITLEQLRQDNGGYVYGASMLKERDLEIVNNLIEKIECTRSHAPQPLDKIIYTDKYGSYYPEAMLEGDTYHDGLPCIVQQASAHVYVRNNGEVSFSTSGGSYDGGKDMSKFEYVGKAKRTFWTWSSAGAGARHGIYFQAEVSAFLYNERADELKHLTSEFLTPIYVYEHEDKPDEYGYRYTAFKSACNYKAWRTRKELDEFLATHHAIKETTPNTGHHKYWIKNAQ